MIYFCTSLIWYSSGARLRLEELDFTSHVRTNTHHVLISPTAQCVYQNVSSNEPGRQRLATRFLLATVICASHAAKTNLLLTISAYF